MATPFRLIRHPARALLGGLVLLAAGWAQSAGISDNVVTRVRHFKPFLRPTWNVGVI